MNKTSLKVLKDLLSQPTPSGYEKPGQLVLEKYMKKNGANTSFDVHGNLHGVINPNAKTKIMLAGHCDEIGLMVMYIDDKGFVYFSAVGGVNVPLLQGEKVIIHNEKGDIPGVIGVKPIHLMTAKERESSENKIDSLWIDIGAKDKEDALKYVTLGDVATIDKNWTDLRNDLVTCRGFDDRIGAFIISDVLRHLKDKKINVAVHAVSTVQEEIGLRGAKTAAEAIKPHIGIAVDVGFATDAPNMNAKMVGEAKCGEGPILHRGPNFNHILHKRLNSVAKKAKISVQEQPIPRGSGTDANAMQLSANHCSTALISIPNRYMHSPVEVINIKDVENCSKLIAELILNLKAEEDFIV